ncbi:MAG: hypothetical protein JWL90_2506, partial [Chthoniobacteraceae bacterium]|nr:hypothetical protein [Chthoniobacteraceae bacterium]
AAYRLLDLQKEVVATGKKVSFCLEDVVQWNPKAPADPKFDCSNQGIHAGWSDVYDSGLPGQWVDITGVPPGKYLLEVIMNPDQFLSEADYGNNVTRELVTIGPP